MKETPTAPLFPARAKEGKAKEGSPQEEFQLSSTPPSSTVSIFLPPEHTYRTLYREHTCTFTHTHMHTLTHTCTRSHTYAHVHAHTLLP